MGRWDDHTEQDKLDTITRKRANQNQKRRAVSAARPVKPRKAKLPSIALPVERVSIVLPVERLIGEAALEPQRKAEPETQREAEPQSTGEQTILLNEKTKRMDDIQKFQDWLGVKGVSAEVRSELYQLRKSRLLFWLYGKYGFAMFEKPTDVSKKAEADRQAKWNQVELEMLAQEKREELEEMEEEYRCSLIRIPPFTELIARAGFNDALRTLIHDLAKALSKEHKRRRKAFDAATQKPVRKVKASDDPMEHTKEMIAFLTWLLPQSQKAISKQSIEKEIARLEGLVNQTKRT